MVESRERRGAEVQETHGRRREGRNSCRDRR